jgi:hypothetical protein
MNTVLKILAPKPPCLRRQFMKIQFAILLSLLTSLNCANGVAAQNTDSASGRAIDQAEIKIKMRLDTPCDTHACGAEKWAERVITEKLNDLCKSLLQSSKAKLLKSEFNGSFSDDGSGYGYLQAVYVDVAANCASQ